MAEALPAKRLGEIPEIVAPQEVIALIAELRGHIPEQVRQLFAACERDATRSGQLQEIVNGMHYMSYSEYRALLRYIRDARSREEKAEKAGLSSPSILQDVERDHPTLLPIVERLIAVRSSLPTMALAEGESPEGHFLSDAAILTRLIFPAASNALNADADEHIRSFHDASHPSIIYFGSHNDPAIHISIGEIEGESVQIAGKWYEYNKRQERVKEVTGEAEVPRKGAFLAGRPLSVPSSLGVNFPQPLEVPVLCKMGGGRASRGGIMVVHTDSQQRYIFNCGSQNDFNTDQGGHIVFYDAQRDVSEIVNIDESKDGGSEQDGQAPGGKP